MSWKHYNTEPPTPGDHVVILADDGMSSQIGVVVERAGGTIAILIAEDGDDLDEHFLRGSLWTEIPDDYRIACMEACDDY